MTMDRPAAKVNKRHSLELTVLSNYVQISPERPGADIAGEIAAAFAAGSMVYSEEGMVLQNLQNRIWVVREMNQEKYEYDIAYFITESNHT